MFWDNIHLLPSEELKLSVEYPEKEIYRFFNSSFVKGNRKHEIQLQ